MNHRCVAIEEQRGWRDLRQLEQAIPVVRWASAQEAVDASEPLVACGLWACREPSASQLLRHRMKAGRASLLVARFEPVDLGPILGAPTSIQIAPGETSALTWEDGQRFEVSGVTVIQTAIPNGHWARSTAGTAVFAYRPHTQAGLVVLCTGTVAGVALGADPAQQRSLLERVLEEMARQAPEPVDEDASGQIPDECSTTAEYLERHGPDGALVLLAALHAGAGSVDNAALAAIGASLPEDRLAGLVAALPSASPPDIDQALRAAGWGAHLRALARRQTEAS